VSYASSVEPLDGLHRADEHDGDEFARNHHEFVSARL
jgi:hypothetical protein